MDSPGTGGNLTSVCALNARCTNIPGSFVCECFPGFSGDGRVACDGKGQANEL